jgi:maltooligosyltrehalose trehalohydrolase
VLDWETRATGGRERLALVRELLAIRRRHITPRLAGARFGEARAIDDGLLTANWRLGDGAKLSLTANLSDCAIAAQPDDASGAPIWGEVGGAIKPWFVLWAIR